MRKSFTFNRYIAFAIIISFAVLSLSSCGFLLPSSTSYQLPADGFHNVDGSTFDPDMNEGYYYQQLCVQEKAIYDSLLAEIKNGGNSCTFTNGTYAQYDTWLNRAVFALHYEHPELFWIACGYSYSYSTGFLDSPDTCEVTVKEYDFWRYISNKNKYITQLDAAVQKVADLASACSTDYEKIQFVHDYIAANAYYDFDGLAESQKTVCDEDSYYIYTAYGCLVNGKTVCSGYAKAFQLVMNRLGYNCIYYTGYAGESHGWNCIYIDDEAYWVDVTWDDPSFEDDKGNLLYPTEAQYEYFCINSEELTQTHVPDNMFKVPDCTASDFGYHEYNNYVIDTYSFDEAKRILTEQKGNIISLKFSNDQAMNDAYSSLINDGKIHKIVNGKDINYQTFIPQRTITFYLK